MRAKVRVIATKIGCKAVHADIFGTVRAEDRDKLPLFAMHQERIFKCSRAKEFDQFHAVTFPFRASTSAR